MKIVEKDDGTYLEFSNLEEAEKEMHKALILLKKTLKHLPTKLSDEIVDFISDNGWPDELPNPDASASPQTGEHPKGESRKDANGNAEVVGRSPKGESKAGALNEVD